MKIAIQNSWPNLNFSAEREFIARVKLAGLRLGWSVQEVVTSDDIRAAEPDVVLVTHEYTPKLTQYPTLGLIWSPTAFFCGDLQRVRNILSYDGYLVASESLREYIRQMLADHGKIAPVSDFDFLPSALSTPENGRGGRPRSLFYAGVHWDGQRHGDIFAALHGRIPMRIHGDPKRWQSAGADFAGPLPFNGEAVVAAIRECGIALALHTEAHRAESVPSMRLFEAAAAGAVIIGDRLDFAIRHFGDSLLYVDADLDARTVGHQIVAHVEWVVANPAPADELARRSHAIFLELFSLERILAKLPGFLPLVRNAMGYSDKVGEDLVEVIVRAGSRPLPVVARAIESLVAQNHPRLGLIVVLFRPVEGLQELLDTHRSRFELISVIEAPDDGFRSTALWIGLAAVCAPFAANLDDDDVIHPNHIASLVTTLRCQSANVPLAYSGTIRVQEEDGHWFDQINFQGDRQDIIKERRCLHFLEPFDVDRLRQFNNYIQSNSWMVRRTALTAEILDDPRLTVAEDVYLYLVLSLSGSFVPSWQPTAEWNWRSTTRDNVMFSPELWGVMWERLLARLADAGVVMDPAPLEVGHNKHSVPALMRAVKRFASERDRFGERAKYAVRLLFSGGIRALVQMILRLGRHR